MVIINPVTAKHLIPWRRGNVFAAVFFPVDVGFVAEDAGTFLSDIRDGHEGADVEADARAISF